MSSRLTHTAETESGATIGEAPRCVWMSAGVLSYWLCPRDFQCEDCPLDRVLSGRPQGADVVRPPAPPENRGDVLHRAERGPLRHLQVPLRRRRGLHYHPDHVWGRGEGPRRLRLGLDDIAARLTEGGAEWSLPVAGARLTTGDSLGEVRTRGGRLRIATPLAGRVVARNEALARWPMLAVWSPYDDGWLIDLESDTPLSTTTGFLDDEAVVAGWFEAEMERLSAGCPDPADNAALGPTLHDGGYPALALATALGEDGLRAAIRRVFPLSR